MARRPNPAMGPAASEETEETGATMEGGSPGVPPAHNEIAQPGAVTRRAHESDAPPAEPIQQFRVAAQATILYGGCRTQLAAGKLVDQYTYDLDLLRRQGVQLEAVAQAKAG